MSWRASACGRSHVGRSRSHNEDAFAVDQERQVYVVADGMGGHGNGELASSLAIEAIGRSIRESKERRGDDPGRGEPSHARVLRDSILAAHRELLEAIARDRSLLGMGTTVVAFKLDSAGGAVAHVGDSRAYRLRDGVLRQVTQDHTWVNEQVLAGFLSAEQARAHPLKSVVTRALGGDREVEVDIQELEVRAGDLYLLCSDGLTSMLSDEQIRARLDAGDGLEQICRGLVDDANQHGGLDNITVVLVSVAEKGS